MKSKSKRKVLALIVILVGLVYTSGPWALAQETKPMATITNQEFVRNGGFNLGTSSWYVFGTSSAVDPSAGQDGGPVMSMEAIFADPGTGSAYPINRQELYLPSQTTAATFVFDYRLIPTGGGWAYFEAGIMKGDTPATATVIASVLPVNWVWQDTGWLHVSFPLSSAEVTQVQTAHAAGQHVWVVFDLIQNGNVPNQFKAHLDNVSFKVTGSMTYPALTGAIAYVGLDNSGTYKMVKRIDPDGSNQQTLWTHPEPLGVDPKIKDVAWKPDASELTFSSNHEKFYSAFHADIYGVKPADGSGLRRITHPPSKAEIDAGAYQMGTVTGRVCNNHNASSPSTFLLYIEGAQDNVSVPIGGYGSCTGFTVPNVVADLGTGSSIRTVTFDWGGEGCAGTGKEQVPAAVPLVPGGTANIGDITFTGNCYDYYVNSISWKRDGSQIGFTLESIPKKVPATGPATITELFSSTLLAHDVAWSPQNDQIVYRNWIISGNSGIYLTTAGGGAGTWKVDDGGALYVTPAWLPDGSGFVYTIDQQIRQYILAGDQDTLLAEFYNEYVLNPSVSPDGNYIVFECQTSTAPNQRDLWIMNRSKPVEMWQLTSDGKSADPDWSRVNPPAGTPDPASISLNYSTGKPGSYFKVSGQNFLASVAAAATATVTVNGEQVGTVDPGAGNFVFSLQTSASAQEGSYIVTVSTNPSASATYQLDKNEPLRAKDPAAGEIVQVPASITPSSNFVYLPIILRSY